MHTRLSRQRLFVHLFNDFAFLIIFGIFTKYFLICGMIARVNIITELLLHQNRENTPETTRNSGESPGNPSYPALYPSFLAPERPRKETSLGWGCDTCVRPYKTGKWTVAKGSTANERREERGRERVGISCIYAVLCERT